MTPILCLHLPFGQQVILSLVGAWLVIALALMSRQRPKAPAYFYVFDLFWFVTIPIGLFVDHCTRRERNGR